MPQATLMPCRCGPDRALVSCRSRSLPLISCAKLWNKLIQFFGDCRDDPKGQIEKSGAQLGSPLYPQEVWLLALVARAVSSFFCRPNLNFM